MKIGCLDFGYRPVMLAPMENISDPSFRKICKEYGADLVFTEFVSSDSLINKVRHSLKKLEISESERPVAIQLYGHVPVNMVRAVEIVNNYRPDIIDLNFGCPQKKISARGAGAGMMRTPDRMMDIVRAVVQSSDVPVTVKTRLGWDYQSINVEEIVEGLQSAGISAVTIHGRTREQGYRGAADWSLIGKIKNNPSVRIPVIGNGDIDSAIKAKAMFDKHGVDGIMIGRAAVKAPWIFREIKEYLATGIVPEPAPVYERIELACRQLEFSVQHKGENRAVREMRKYLISYFSDLPDPSGTRGILVRPEKASELTKAIKSLA